MEGVEGAYKNPHRHSAAMGRVSFLFLKNIRT
jgi:hypothetical protein